MFRALRAWALEEASEEPPTMAGPSTSKPFSRPFPSTSVPRPIDMFPEEEKNTRELFAAMESLYVSTNKLDFGAASDLRKSLKVTLRNTNTCDYPAMFEHPPLVWKAMTTLHKHYCVRPNMGVLKSGESVEIEFIREPKSRFLADPDAMKKTPAFLIRSSPFLQNWSPVLSREDPTNREAIQELWKKLGTLEPSTVSEFRIEANKFAVSPDPGAEPLEPLPQVPVADQPPIRRTSPSKRIRRDQPVVPNCEPRRRPSEVSIADTAYEDPGIISPIVANDDKDEGRAIRHRSNSYRLSLAAANLSAVATVGSDVRNTPIDEEDSPLNNNDGPGAVEQDESEIERLRRENATLRARLEAMALNPSNEHRPNPHQLLEAHQHKQQPEIQGRPQQREVQHPHHPPSPPLPLPPIVVPALAPIPAVNGNITSPFRCLPAPPIPPVQPQPQPQYQTQPQYQSPRSRHVAFQEPDFGYLEYSESAPHTSVPPPYEEAIRGYAAWS